MSEQFPAQPSDDALRDASERSQDADSTFDADDIVVLEAPEVLQLKQWLGTGQCPAQDPRQVQRSL